MKRDYSFSTSNEKLSHIIIVITAESESKAEFEFGYRLSGDLKVEEWNIHHSEVSE